MAAYTGDTTWDWVDAGFMALFAFTTPWTVGTHCGLAHRRTAPIEGYIAICVWMFCASWSYDGYLVLRNGTYPSTWAANIGASGFLYLLNGVLFSLERGGRNRVGPSFMRAEWPDVEPSGLSRGDGCGGLAIVVPVGLALGAFLVTELWL